MLAEKVQKWKLEQTEPKFDKKFWLSLGKYDLPLYLHDQVPPNTLQLFAPAPSGSPAVKPLPADQNVFITLDIRHFHNLIDNELSKIKEAEYRKISNMTSIDLTIDSVDPLSLGIPAEKIILIEAIIKFSETILKWFLLWDWKPNSDYYNSDDIYYDSVIKSYQYLTQKKYVERQNDSRLPRIRDLLSCPSTIRVKHSGCGAAFERIQMKINNISQFLSGLGFRHPMIFGFISNQDFYHSY